LAAIMEAVAKSIAWNVNGQTV